ncbi:M23 family metallopeptidase [Acinetobacter modestus]|uniref:M23 family metallopeptidase n=1 Tax=Acinetobacter modestus TaxID=1776740 RepID=UPI0030188216
MEWTASNFSLTLKKSVLGKGIAMKYSLLSILVGSLLLAGCGGGDDQKNPPNDTLKPVQPQPDANTAVITLGSNNNVVSLNNVAQATFSTEDAKNNPVISIQKAQDKDLVEPFNWAKQVLDIENGSDYEVTLTSSKPLGSTVDMELAVPAELVHALNDQNALAAYIVVNGDDDDSEQDFFPITSTYNPETQKLLVTLPDWALQADDSDKPVNVTMKIGLAKAITDEPATPLTAMARMLTLPTEGESVKETQNTFKLVCPVQNGICTETSRFGKREPRGEGAGPLHKGVDFRATSANSLIAATAGTVIRINKADGSIALRIDGGKSTLIYRHMSEIDPNIKVMDPKNNISGDIAAGTLLGKAGKVGVKSEHLHLELINQYGIAVCKGPDDQHITCNAKISAPIDPFPYFVNSVKLVKKSPQNTSITTGQKFNLELQGFDKNNNRITSEINNMESPTSPKGTLRTVTWALEPATSAYTLKPDETDINGKALTPKSDSVAPTKRSSATVTVNQEEPATITAYWDGLENLKAEYSIQNEDIKQATLTISNTQDGWDGLPATMLLTELNKRSIYDFQSNGNSDTCETGERGTPLFSQVVDSLAIFYSALTATGVPNQLNGPFINRKNCSSFVAVRDIPDPTDVAKPSKKRIWINATGRAWRINSGAGVISDWEYQVRYDSGDPFNNFLGKRCDIGVVPNSGVFVVSWKASDCKIDLK